MKTYEEAKLEGLGVEEDNRPECPMVGIDGNVFSIIGQVSKYLRKAGLANKAAEFQARATKGECEDYDQVLQLCFQYVEPT